MSSMQPMIWEVAEPLRFTVPGMPRGKQRVRVTRKGHAYTPGETIVYENWVKHCAMTAMGDRELLQGPLSVSLTLHMPIPGSWSKKKRKAAAEGILRPLVKPDASNVAKSIEDGMEGVVYQDDKTICQLTVNKVYSGMARVEVEVKEI